MKRFETVFGSAVACSRGFRRPQFCGYGLAFLGIALMGGRSYADHMWTDAGAATGGYRYWSDTSNWSPSSVPHLDSVSIDYTTSDQSLYPTTTSAALTIEIASLNVGTTVSSFSITDVSGFNNKTLQIDGSSGNLVTVTSDFGSGSGGTATCNIGGVSGFMYLKFNSLGIIDVENNTGGTNYLQIYSPISGYGFTKTGDGVLWLESANSYTGGTTVDSGVLAIGSPNSIPNDTYGVTIESGARFDLEGQTVAAGVGRSLTISGDGSGPGAIVSTSGTGSWGGTVYLADNTSVGSGNK